jgi:glycosyltransferase involved in cell wall biosynthesis
MSTVPWLENMRMRDGFNQDENSTPLVTVVTVVFNDAQHIEATIQSVISQTYANIEHIIIDGGSTDGTLDIIKKYEGRIDCWLSERDDGIYDAMNKGINLSSGDWLGFMNSGDVFFDFNVVESVFKNIDKIVGKDIVYGDALITYPEYAHMGKLMKAGLLNNLWKGMQFSHQSMFASAKHLKQNKFNLENKLTADFEYIYSAYCQHKEFLYIEKTISSVSAGGASDIKRSQSCRERLSIVSGLNKDKLANNLIVRLYYSVKIVDSLVRGLIKHVFPSCWVRKIIQIKK